MAAYDVAVRQALNQAGIGNERIGYNQATGTVTVDNKEFIKPQQITQGRSFTDQPTFNQALQQIQGQQVQPIQQPTQQTVNPYDIQANTILSQLMNQIQSPQQFDPYSSPQYQAAQQQIQQQAQQGVRSAQEALGASGFGRSTNLAERAQRIQNEANQYLQTQVIPQIIAQNQAQQQQQFGNLLNVLGATTQQQGLYGTRQQQQFENQLAQEQIAYQKLRDQIADERYKNEFDEDTRRFGLKFALEKQLQTGKLNLDQAQQSLRESQFEVEQQQIQQGPSQQDLMAQAIQFAQRDQRVTNADLPPTQQEMNQIVQEYLNMLTNQNQSPQQGLGGFMDFATRFSQPTTQNQSPMAIQTVQTTPIKQIPVQTTTDTETVTEAKNVLNDADSKDGALNYIEGIREYLTDAEYNQLIDYVNANF